VAPEGNAEGASSARASEGEEAMSASKSRISACASVLGKAGAAARWGKPIAVVAAKKAAPLLALPVRASGLPLVVYVGQTRQKTLIARLQRVGFGETVVRGEWPPRRTPWFYDNGAFRDFTAGRDFDAVRFEYEINRMAGSPRPRPDFVILPDRVADAPQTFALATYWIDRIQSRLRLPDQEPFSLALALQDGMTEAQVARFLPHITTLFVGGSREWKWKHAARWAAFAHAHGKRLHIGRAGTPRLARMAREANADSIDSAFPLWSTRHLDVFISAIEGVKLSREAIALEEETLRKYGAGAAEALSPDDLKQDRW